MKLCQLDFLQFLAALPDESVDCFLTDPPYWTLETHRNIGTTTRLGGHKDADKQDGSKWFEVIDADDLRELLKQAWRVLKPNTHAYFFCDQMTLRYMLSYADDMDWRYVKPLVWDKMTMGMGYHYRCQHEFIVFMEKGKRRLNNLGIADVLRVPKIVGGYPTEKPVELMKILVEQSTKTGEVVCDPFFGSGSVAMACRELDRCFIGNDLSPAAHEYLADRVKQMRLI